MITRVRWLIPAGCFALGLYLLRLSFDDYAKWQEYLTLGDSSGAEIHEVEFWPTMLVSIALILLSAFLAGRWSVRRP